MACEGYMAERGRFELPIGLPLCRISSAVHSTTLPPLRNSEVSACGGRYVHERSPAGKASDRPPARRRLVSTAAV